MLSVHRPRGASSPPTRHLLLTFAAGVAAGLCAATLALRAWTLREPDGPPAYPDRPRATYFWGGGVTVAELHDAPGPEDRARGTDYQWGFLGFYTSGQEVGRAGYARYWGVRLAYPAAGFGALAVLLALPVLLGRRAGRLRRSRGLCVACGYDLRGTPDRCPECGAVPTGAAA